jgi:hypothetical protein
MKILSRFKDYYDYVARQNGGGDPKIVYRRDYVVPDRYIYGILSENCMRVPRHLIPPQPKDFVTQVDGKRIMHEFRILVVMDRYYWLERTCESNAFDCVAQVIKEWHVTQRPILRSKFNDHIFARLTPEERKAAPPVSSDWYHARPELSRIQQEQEWEKWHEPQGQQRKSLVDLCKLVKAPVFLVDGNSEHVCGRVPKLGELGFVQYYSAEQLYQELAMFISNVLAPFEDPPSPMSNIEKVVSHGFDKKTSFRHR